MGKVKCLKMDPITDKSGHQMVGMAVSVCLTPAAPSPLPIPYPTVGTVAEGVADVCMRTKVSGAKLVTVGSIMKKCHGNEAGTLKEVVSLNTAGPCFPALGALTVISELGFVGITGSIGQMNKSITPGGGGSASGAGGNAGGGGGGGGGAGSPSGQSSQDPSNSGGSGGGGNSGAGAPSPGSSSNPSDQHTCQNGHPVDVVSGCVVDQQTDVEIPGLIAVVFKRYYHSMRRNDLSASLGPGWAHNFEQRVVRDGNLLHLRDEEGRRVTFEHVRRGESTFHRRERMWLHGEDRGYRVERLDDRLTYHYERFDARDDSAPAVLMRIEDKRGNKVRLVYDHGQLQRVVDTAGRHVEIHWEDHDEHTRIAEVRVVVSGRTMSSVHYSYAGKDGCLTQVVDACRHAETYAYDRRRRMVSATLKNGVEFQYEYDDATNRCIHTWGPNGLYELTFEYDLVARRTIARGEEPRVYDWNDDGRMVREATPSGVILEQRGFDQDNYLIVETDGDGQGPHYWYDELGQLTRVVDASDNETRYEHAHGRVTKRKSADGLETTFQYDEVGDRIGMRYPTGAAFSITRDSRGRITAIHGPFGRLVAYEYDSQHNPIVEYDGRGLRTEIKYDPLGRPIQRTDADGRTTRTRYDALGRRTALFHPDGTSTHFTYDEMGRESERTDRLGRHWRYRHDGMGVLTEVTEPSGARWVLTYTGFERLASITDPSGAVYDFTYDDAGRVVHETTFDGRRLSYLYNTAGLIEEVQHDDGSARAYRYDLTRRLVEEGATDSSRTHYQRDRIGRVIAATLREDGEDIELTFERDQLGRIVAETQDGERISTQWDILDRRTARVLPDGQVTTYQYDNNDALAALIHALDQSSSHRLDFELNHAGMALAIRASVTPADGESAWSPRFSLTQQFDAMNRLVSQRVEPASPSASVGTAVVRGYQYDRGGRVSQVDDQRWGATRIDYDSSDRLLSWSAGKHREAFSYDEAGTIETALRRLAGGEQRKDQWDHAAGNRLQRTPDATFEYDERGRRVRKVEAHADDGTELVTEYEWDARDRLRKVRLPDNTHVAYRYDALGRRQRKEQFGTSGELERTVRFLWDQDELCSDRVEGEAWRHFVQHPSGGFPLLHVERGEVFTAVNDQVGVVRALIDKAGHVAWSGTYSAWGTRLDDHADETSRRVRGWDVSSPFRLLGQYHDDETGLACTRYRYFDAETARWCSPDPIGLLGGLNLFGFNQSPSLVVDLLGLADGRPHGGDTHDGRYYRAERGADDRLHITSGPISEAEARSAMRNGDGVYTNRRRDAEALARSVDPGGRAVHDAPHVNRDTDSASGRFPHYHPSNRNAGHAWYGTAAP